MTTPASNSKDIPDTIAVNIGDPADTATPKRSPFGVRKGTTVSGGTTTEQAPRDTPPKSRKRSTGSTAGTTKNNSTEAPYQAGVIQAGLEGMYGQIGMFVGMFDPDIGSAVLQNAQAMAASMENLAKESPATRAFLNKLVATSAIGQVIAAHTPVAMVIAVKYIPAIRNRVNPPAPAPGDNGTGTPGNTKVA